MFNKEKDEKFKEREIEFDLFQEEFLKNLDNNVDLSLMNDILTSVKDTISTRSATLIDFRSCYSASSLMYLLFNFLNETVQIKSNISDLKESNNDLNTKSNTLIKQYEELTNEFKELNNKFDKQIKQNEELNNKFDKLIELLSKE